MDWTYQPGLGRRIGGQRYETPRGPAAISGVYASVFDEASGCVRAGAEGAGAAEHPEENRTRATTMSHALPLFTDRRPAGTRSGSPLAICRQARFPSTGLGCGPLVGRRTHQVLDHAVRVAHVHGYGSMQLPRRPAPRAGLAPALRLLDDLGARLGRSTAHPAEPTRLRRRAVTHTPAAIMPSQPRRFPPDRSGRARAGPG